MPVIKYLIPGQAGCPLSRRAQDKPSYPPVYFVIFRFFADGSIVQTAITSIANGWEWQRGIGGFVNHQFFDVRTLTAGAPDGCSFPWPKVAIVMGDKEMQKWEIQGETISAAPRAA